MNYDIAFRYWRALQPEGLLSIATARDALADAMNDARNAGIDPERDPAVILLARHLGRIASGEDVTLIRASDGEMRSACMSKIDELRRKPALVALARRGITYDADAKTAFHREAKSSLRALARELGLGPDDYDLRSNYGGVAVSGEITLHSDQAYIQFSLGGMGAGREIMYRRCCGRSDYSGDRNHYCDIAKAAHPASFAAHIARDLQLEHVAPRQRELID
jgi:hypothetical protein